MSLLDIPINYEEFLRKPHSRKKLTIGVLKARATLKINARHQICKRLGTKNGIFRVFRGLKRCTNCDVYYDTNELRCPCCNLQLRSNRRDNPETSRNPVPDYRKRL